MKQVIIISDIHNYCNPYLEEHFKKTHSISKFKISELAELDTHILSSKDAIHKEMIENDGLSTAIQNLIFQIGSNSIDHAFGFSMGGLVLWKAINAGLLIHNLHCFSTTRLRLETSKPKSNLNLIFGAKDNFKPSVQWFTQLQIRPKIFEDSGHEFYTRITNFEEFIHRP